MESETNLKADEGKCPCMFIVGKNKYCADPAVTVAKINFSSFARFGVPICQFHLEALQQSREFSVDKQVSDEG